MCTDMHTQEVPLIRVEYGRTHGTLKEGVHEDGVLWLLLYF